MRLFSRILFIFTLYAALLTSAIGTTATAYFAGGCFWCVEADFDKLPGVTTTTSGYAGGEKQDAKYKIVSSGTTKHVEAVKVVYDPKVVSYQKLLDYFWRHIDPTDAKGQFCDKGSQYISVIYYTNPEEEELARESRHALRASGQFDHIATKIEKFHSFYPAEKYHQNYYKKNPVRYQLYRRACGRDQRVEKVWSEQQ